jgi:prepilin-type N-terminal cleavage/methylation domain-containing protein
MKHAKALTLLELLVATVIASIAVTVAYSFFNTIEKANIFTHKRFKLQNIVPPIYQTMLEDIECADTRYGHLYVHRGNEGNSIELYTKNCFFFPGVCKVTYRTHKGFLIREEARLNAISAKGIEIPIVSGVESIDILTFTGSKWHRLEGTGALETVKVVLTTEGGELPMVFVIRAETSH